MFISCHLIVDSKEPIKHKIFTQRHNNTPTTLQMFIQVEKMWILNESEPNQEKKEEEEMK